VTTATRSERRAGGSSSNTMAAGSMARMVRVKCDRSVTALSSNGHRSIKNR
jgi:hypothetical protein